jgi:TPR repeat protein
LQGDDDEELQFTVMMAEKGDVEAMNSYANLLYWGARGFARDHDKALELWEKAAVHDHVGALCGAASMYVRGEGTDVNVERAVELYERAAAMGSPTALNGLGYAYFLGQGGLEEDKERAFGYFLEAAELMQDADSLGNAAHCYSTGQGTPKDEVKAASFYEMSVTKFGNFDAALELGRRYREGGRGVGRSADRAIDYLTGVARAGESGELMRAGFDLYAARARERSERK